MGWRQSRGPSLATADSWVKVSSRRFAVGELSGLFMCMALAQGLSETKEPGTGLRFARCAGTDGGLAVRAGALCRAASIDRGTLDESQKD
jgi:hypothetical protein